MVRDRLGCTQWSPEQILRYISQLRIRLNAWIWIRIRVRRPWSAKPPMFLRWIRIFGRLLLYFCLFTMYYQCMLLTWWLKKFETMLIGCVLCTAGSLTYADLPTSFKRLREAAKKNLVARPQRPFPPPPSSLVATFFVGYFFRASKKVIFS